MSHKNSNKNFESSPWPSHPHYSFWVMASAGTGKTKLLIDRVLRLLLMGTNPKKIVCLTYTKAAAHEMSTRITEKLKHWMGLSEDDLSVEITPFLIENLYKSEAQDFTHIRSLLKKVHTTPIAIQTIHSFCQKILTAYPFEADLPLDFDMMNERESDVLKEKVIHSVLNNTAFESELSLIATKISESYVRDCLRYALDYRTKFLGDFSKSSTKRRVFFEEEHVAPLTQHEVEDCFWIAEKIAQFGPKTLTVLADNILRHDRCTAKRDGEDFIPLFLTKEGKPRAKVATKALLLAEPVFLEVFERLSKRVEALYSYGQIKHMIAVNEAFDTLVQKAFNLYQIFKENKLDFDDLILKTQSLLEHGPPWVQQVIDSDIDHLLVDEAQDTSPLQWDILKRLTHHWGDRLSSTHTPRTFFVVGDMKQSIYSFQGADPHFYERMADYFEDTFAHYGLPFFRIPLDMCYRCAPEILEVVDKVCNQDHVRSSLLGGADPVQHYPHKKGEGKVVAWPRVNVTHEDENCLRPWTLLDHKLEKKDSKQELAQRITQKVLRILSAKDSLPSTGKTPKPLDIFILMKRRGSFMRTLQASLINAGVPVIAHDPSAFLDHLFVKDMLAFLLFLACPFDDLNLCSLLKSPAFGVSEDNLMRFCRGRKGSVWQALCFDEDLLPHYTYLKTLLNEANNQSCYSLLYLFSKMALPRYVYGHATMGEVVVHDTYPLAEIACLHKKLLNLALEASYTHGFSPYKMYESITGNALSSPAFTDAPNAVAGSVALMTIHGSKGLQAPIVILVDDGGTGGGIHDPFIFGEGFYILRQQGEHLQSLKNMTKDADAKEDHRLLYVALTRAQDHVYMTGVPSKKNDGHDDFPCTWYDGIAPFATQEDWNEEEEKTVLVKDAPLSLDVSFVSNISLKSLRAKHQSLFVSTPQKSSEKACHGMRVHKFLECLARYPKNEVDFFVSKILSKDHALFSLFSDLSEPLKNHLVTVYHQYIAPLVREGCGFQELSLYDDKGALHRIDHVIVTEQKVLILDYKTGASHPSHKEQLERYARVLFPLYPHHAYEGVLVFTHDPLRFERYDLLKAASVLKHVWP